MDVYRVVIAKPLSQQLAQHIASSDERIQLVYEPQLYPPMRWPSDHFGDPDFKRSQDQQARFVELMSSADVLYGIPDGSSQLLKQVIEANPRLRWVMTMASGGGQSVKAANLSAEQLQRVVFTTAAGVHAANLAEWTLLALLAGAKNLPVLQHHQRQHYWQPQRWPLRMLSDMTIVVVGMGAIGRECALRLRQFGVRVIGVNRSVKQFEGLEKLYTSEQIVAAFNGADGFVNALPGAIGTEHLISREAMAALNPGALVASVGRGTCIDEAAMIDLLKTGHLAFAGLDVTEVEPLPQDSPLWDMPNVLICPHIAANAEQEDERIAEIFIDNFKAFADGRQMRNVVDTQRFY